MIRRKLTRLEVTLDDTKELDDLFSKPTQIGLISSGTATATTTAATKLSNQFYQKQLLLLGKQYDQGQQTLDSGIEQANSGAASGNSNIGVINLETATVVTGSNTVEHSTGTGSSSIIVGVTESSLGYNPQPYNSSNRFQFNQESQQLR